MKAGIGINLFALLLQFSGVMATAAAAAPESQKIDLQKAEDEKPLLSTYGTGDNPSQAVKEAEWKVRRLQEALRLDPKNEKTRMTLVQTFESLAAYHEQKLNSLDAWRYYGAAARVLTESGDAEKLKKRIAYDQSRAEKNHQLRLQYLRRRKRVGFVYTSFQWLDYPKLDRTDALAYTAKVSNAIRNAWSDAEQNRHITDGGRLPKPLIVSFDVHRSGKMSGLKIDSSCGLSLVDQAAVKAVSEAGPMPALLPAMGDVVHFQSQFVK